MDAGAFGARMFAGSFSSRMVPNSIVGSSFGPWPTKDGTAHRTRSLVTFILGSIDFFVQPSSSTLLFVSPLSIIKDVDSGIH